MKFYNFADEYEKQDELFKVWCEGKRIKTYACDVSAVAFNQVWQGRQRSFSQTEKSAFVTLGNDGETVLTIQPKKSFQKVVVRPLEKNVKTEARGNEVEITFTHPGQYTVEFDGMHYTLAVFINPEKDFSAYRNGKNVLYFGEGVHYVDKRIMLEDNQTVFIDEGAVVYASINAIGKKNIQVVGYGILDNSRMERQNAIQTNPNIVKEENKKMGLPIYFDRCENILVEGITIVDSSEWSLKFTGCKNVLVDNIKLIGLWRYNADGCDFCNCVDATIKNSFLRTFDDSIVVKGLDCSRELPVENILAENCVVWCDWGRCLEIGAETCAPYMKNITFRNCYLIHGSDVMMDVQQGDSADISQVLFDNVSIEYTGEEQRTAIETDSVTEYPYYGIKHIPRIFEIRSLVTMWSHDSCAGNTDDVRFQNIRIVTADGEIPQGSRAITRGEGNRISNVVFENITCNGKRVTLQELGFSVDGNVENVIEK